MRTNWTSLREYYGFSRPYNFRVAAPFLLNSVGVAAAFIVAAVMLLNGTLTVGTERFFFFMYLMLALCVALALSRIPRISIAIFLWCCIEGALALSSTILPSSAPVTPLFPRNILAAPAIPYLVYHPLLQIVPRPAWQYTWTFRQRNPALHPDFPVNIKLGEEFKFSHNSLGLRGPELTENDYSLDMIFIYGGSTTYDVTVSDGDTWVEQLQTALQGRATVLNFGVPGYSSEEHLIQTAFYQEVHGRRPKCAVYYVGWNDILNAHIDDLDPAYADRHVLGMAAGARPPELWAAKYSPVFRLISQLASRRFDTVPKPPVVAGEPADVVEDPRLERIFSSNVNSISAINRSRHIRTVFIGQILNRSWFEIHPEALNPDSARLRNKNTWPTQERFNALLKQNADTNDDAYIDAGVEHFGAEDFTDDGHFSALGAKKFSSLIARDVDNFCGLAVNR